MLPLNKSMSPLNYHKLQPNYRKLPLNYYKLLRSYYLIAVIASIPIFFLTPSRAEAGLIFKAPTNIAYISQKPPCGGIGDPISIGTGNR